MRKGWEYKKLGEVTSFFRGLTYSGKDEVDKSNNIVLRSNNIDLSTNSLNFDELKFISDSITIPQDKKIRKNSIFMCMSNGSKQHLGKVAFIEKEYPYAFGGFMGLIVPNEDKLVPKFTYYYFCSQKFKAYLSAIGNGANINNIKYIDIAKDSIPLPPLSTQLAIVSELDKINELIRLKKEQLKDSDNLAQSIFYEMFGDPVENEKGWEVKKLGEVCNITSSKRIFADEYTDKGIPFYRSKEVIERSKGLPISVELFISPERYSEIKEKFGIPNVGDILVTAVGTIGKIWSIDTDEKFYFKDGNLVWLKDIDSSLVNTIFFRRLLEYLIDEYKKINANGAAYSALTIAKLKLMQCPLPPLPLQQLFAHRIEQIEHQKSEVQKAITDLETLLASRMQYWFE